VASSRSVSKAQGVFPFGVLSRGVVSCGVLSIGVITVGLASLGILAAGACALAVVAAFGVLAIAPFAIGVQAIGVVAGGVQAIVRSVVFLMLAWAGAMAGSLIGCVSSSFRYGGPVSMGITMLTTFGLFGLAFVLELRLHRMSRPIFESLQNS